MEIINLTPHPVSFYTADDADPRTHVLYDGPAKPWLVLLPRAGADGRADPARVDVAWAADGGERYAGIDFEIPVFAPDYGRVSGLPAPDGQHVYIVSKQTVDAARAEGRDCSDLRLVSQTVRDPYGRIVGCLGISRP